MPPSLLIVLIVGLGLAACTPAPSTDEDAAGPGRPIDPTALALADSAAAMVQDFSLSFGRGDTTQLRRAIEDLRRAHELDPHFTEPLHSVSSAYLMLGEPDSAVAALELGVAEDPGLAEVIGYIRFEQGREREAIDWFERARAHLAGTISGRLASDSEEDREVWAASHVRLTWLAQGQQAASAVAEDLPPPLRATPQVRYVECVASRSDRADFIGQFGFSQREPEWPPPLGEAPPQSEAERCASLLLGQP